MAGEASEWGFTKCITGVKSTSVLFSKRGWREGSSGWTASHHRRFSLPSIYGRWEGEVGWEEGRGERGWEKERGAGGRQTCVRWNGTETQERSKEGKG